MLAATVCYRVAAPAGAAQARQANLSGEWVLNPDQSDDPQRELQRQMRVRGGGLSAPVEDVGRGGRGSVAGGAAAVGVGHGGAGDREGAAVAVVGRAGDAAVGVGRAVGEGGVGAEVGRPDGERLGRKVLLDAEKKFVARGPGLNAGVEELTIDVVESGVQITNALDRDRVLLTDREWRVEGSTGERQSYWKKAKLVTRRRGRGEALVIEEYSLSKEDQLVVSIQSISPLGTTGFKRVYDRKPGP